MKKTFTGALSVLIAALLMLSVPTVLATDDVNVQWGSFRGNGNNIATTTGKTPTAQDNTKLLWTAKLKENTDWSKAVSDPLMIDDKIYIAVGDELQVIDNTGKCINTAKLSSAIGYTSRLAYSNGAVMVPISDGALQAVSISDLSTKWQTTAVDIKNADGLAQTQQSLTTVTVDGDYAFMGTACADWSTTYNGVYRCINTANGEVVWQNLNNSKGYYWSGAVVSGDALVLGGDDGKLTAFNKYDGKLINAVDLNAPIRSTVVNYNNKLFCTTTDGTLHRIAIAEDGTLSDALKVDFAESSTVTPAVYNGKVYVGGGLGSADSFMGVMAVINADTLAVEQSVKTPKTVQSSPLLTTAYTKGVFAYYTCNAMPGGMYVLDDSSMLTEAQVLFTPDDDKQNYCMSSAIADRNGTLYYTNDSGTLFAIAPINDEEPTQTPTQAPTEEPTVSPTQTATDVPTQQTTEVSTQNASTGNSSANSSSSSTAAASSNSSSQASSDTPKTGDTGIALTITMVAIVCLCGGVMILVKRKSSNM
ncbi:MAG TPA: PQQ-binding-like beta-propeller repeat protein [Clostridiales bacterium]|nr:PQQ-binding-like beta-propeller repeat protein [Clostridiales bacterium]